MQSKLLESLNIPMNELYSKAKEVAYKVVKENLKDRIEMYFYVIQKRYKDIATLAGRPICYSK